MTFTHMHHALANKALAIVGCEAKTDADYWSPSKARLRELVLSGAVDYRDRMFPASVTAEDRQIVLNYLAA